MVLALVIFPCVAILLLLLHAWIGTGLAAMPPARHFRHSGPGPVVTADPKSSSDKADSISGNDSRAGSMS